MFSKLMILSVLTFGLTGCTTLMGSVGTECSIWKPITWSKKDTAQTVEEVKINNARREAWCAKGL